MAQPLVVRKPGTRTEGQVGYRTAAGHARTGGQQQDVPTLGRGAAAGRARTGGQLRDSSHFG